MATDADVRKALVEATGAVLHQPLTPAQEDDVYSRFRTAGGTPLEKAKKAIKDYGKLTEAEYQTRKLASDNTDRKVRDLEDALREWKPKQ